MMRHPSLTPWLRRTFLKTAAAACLGWILAPGLRGDVAGRNAPARRPNIIFILADDLGPDGLGCYGSEYFKDCTPRLDALAAGGLRFTHCYATALCSPTRAQYATGQYPFRNGVVCVDARSNYYGDPHKPMLTKMLKDAGYWTGKFGKTDICRFEPDEYLGGGGGYWEKDGKPSNWKIVGPTRVDPERFGYTHDAYMAFVLDFIERNAPRPENGHRPFYFFCGLGLPHVPIKPTPDSLEFHGGAPAGETEKQRELRHYTDDIRYIDKIVGAIVDKLKETGALDNTVLLFSGDNGSYLSSPIRDERTGKYRRISGGKGDRASNREGTALVPLVVHWPAGIPKSMIGSVRDELVDFTDFLPTYAELEGATPPAEWELHGHSFAPLLRGDPSFQPREWAFHQIWASWCVRGPNYRLNEDGKFFDMSDAPFGMVELTELTPEQRILREKYQAVLDKLDPFNGPTYEAFMDVRRNAPEWEWKSKHFSRRTFETAASGDAADPDGDGVPNILERAFGWDPSDGRSRLPQPQYADGQWRLTLPEIASKDVQIIVEKRAGAGQWAPVAPTDGNPRTFAVRQPDGKDAGFLRVRGERVRPFPKSGPTFFAETKGGQ